jgi:hypothetical protein
MGQGLNSPTENCGSSIEKKEAGSATCKSFLKWEGIEDEVDV